MSVLKAPIATTCCSHEHCAILHLEKEHVISFQATIIKLLSSLRVTLNC